MSDPAQRTRYADRAWQGTVFLDENVRMACDTYRLRFRCPEMARQIVPGQFLMIRLAKTNDPLLGRPMALYDTVLGDDGRPSGLEVVYLVVGKMTRRLAMLAAGSPLETWGPLGNGFPPTPTGHLLMVAGGIGQTPFMALAREALGLRSYGDPSRQVQRAARVTLCYGVRSVQYMAGVEQFQRMGVEVRVSTEDGSAGHPGLVTELIEPAAGSSAAACRIVACGPERMMEATAKIAKRLGVPCQVSLESPMACGIGACFSCVAKVHDRSGHWDYRRTCVEGPVFDAEEIEF
jgi:dihydroorotate dehydrogenase electron transfer subunit